MRLVPGVQLGPYEVVAPMRHRHGMRLGRIARCGKLDEVIPGRKKGNARDGRVAAVATRQTVDGVEGDDRGYDLAAINNTSAYLWR